MWFIIYGWWTCWMPCRLCMKLRDPTERHISDWHYWHRGTPSHMPPHPHPDNFPSLNKMWKRLRSRKYWTKSLSSHPRAAGRALFFWLPRKMSSPGFVWTTIRSTKSHARTPIHWCLRCTSGLSILKHPGFVFGILAGKEEPKGHQQNCICHVRGYSVS